MDVVSGTLALIGGGEFRPESTFESTLFPAGCTVHMLPTAQAYENPTATLERARVRCAELGVTPRVVEAYTRPHAFDQGLAAEVASATHLYVLGGSPMHLRSVLLESPLLAALVATWQRGSTAAVSGEAASVLCSHMVDSRGGAYTVGLGLITAMTVIPRHDTWSPDKLHRTVRLAAADQVVVGIDECTALVRASDGGWSVEGAGGVHVYEGGHLRDLHSLPHALNPDAGI
jgi:cyanophycinase